MLCTVALSQIMTRMKLDFTGRPATDLPAKGLWSTRGMMLTIISFWAFLNVFVLLGVKVKIASGIGMSPADFGAVIMINLAMVFYMVYATAQTRGSIRDKYLIREEKFVDLEDNVCAIACMPCTISQMGRHTVDYKETSAACCSDTGLLKLNISR